MSVRQADAELQSAVSDKESKPKLGEMVPIDQAIAFFEKRIQGKPSDVANRVVLGRLYLRKASEEDDLPYYSKAENVLAEAMNNNQEHLPAKIYYAKALMARHEFQKALALGQTVIRRRPDNAIALSIVGDCQLELGQYAEAEQTYETLLVREKSGGTIARQAHLKEIMGEPDAALRLMREAASEAKSSGAMETDLAWYDLRIAVMLHKAGDWSEAQKFYELALDRHELYGPAMSGLASLHAATGDFDRSIKLYLEAIREHGEPPMMWGLGDVYTAMGDEEQASHWYLKTEKAMMEEAETAAAAHFREVARFYCDTDRHLDRALELAREDLNLRQDIYAHDLLAWAQFKNEQFADAEISVQKALRTNVQDAEVHYHAGRIREALGNHQEAMQAYDQALKINPNFSVTLANDARDRRDRLRTEAAN
ncbi:tetratricopeptide repeat protein [Stieleria varia]